MYSPFTFYFISMTKTHSQIPAAIQDADARALKILHQRLWHFTSVGLGNCHAARRVRREIEQLRTAAVPGRSKVPMPAMENSSSHCPSHIAAPEVGCRPDHALASLSLEQLTAGLAHLESIGLANSRSAQIVRGDPHRRAPHLRRSIYARALNIS